MAGHNRYLYGETNQIKVPVHGNVTVEPGDLICIAGVTEVAGKFNCTADYYAHPLSSVTGAKVGDAANHIKQYFLGVAMDGSPNGVTNYISVAQSGFFRYPLVTLPGVTGTTIGWKVSAVSPASATGGASNQYVGLGITATGGGSGSTAYLGYCSVNKDYGASFVDFFIRGKYGPGGFAS